MFMDDQKRVKDLMVDIFEYPHMPYWFTINQALKVLKYAQPKGGEVFCPPEILIFDEKYNFLGIVCFTHILKGIESKMLTTRAETQAPQKEGYEMFTPWDSPLRQELRQFADKAVSEVMIPAKLFVEPGDLITKAAYLMSHNELTLLPVLEGEKKFVGLVRLVEIFHVFSGAMLET